MTHTDVTFYLGVLMSIIGLFSLLWRLTVGQTIKRIQDDMVTKLDLAKEFAILKEWLRKEYVAKK